MEKITRAVKIQEVAKAAQVSIATVSYVMNGRGHISQETRERVLKTAERLGYKPNSAGRALASQRGHAVGVILPMGSSLLDSMMVNVMAGLADHLRTHAYDLVLFASQSTIADTLSVVFDALKTKRINGVVCLDRRSRDVVISAVHEAEVPIVWLGQVPDEAWVDLDRYRGGRIATQYLLGLGHHSIVHLALNSSEGRLIRQGFEDAMREVLPSDRVVVEETDGTIAGGYQAMHRLGLSGFRATAVFAASNSLAEGVLRAAGELGLAVPQQLSVVGFGDAALVGHTIPPLTTVISDGYALGVLLAEVALDRVDTNRVRGASSVPSLHVGASCAPAGHYETPGHSADLEMIKRGCTFAIFSHQATIDPLHPGSGLFDGDTRLVHLYRAYADDVLLRPIAVERDIHRLTWSYVVQHAGFTRHLRRTLSLFPDHWEDTWQWRHYGQSPSEWQLAIQVGCDFRDVFELRGVTARDHGPVGLDHREEPSRYGYEGLDGIERSVEIEASRPPGDWQGDHIRWTIGAQEPSGSLTLRVSWQNPAVLAPMRNPVEDAVPWPTIETNRLDWKAVLDQSCQDLRLLLTDFGQGPVLMAGLPWFGTLFGRDAVLSAMELLEWVPTVAENTVATLAAWQGAQNLPDREEEPGKILHEMRLGEWANRGMVPFGRYYGSVDVTPLYISLLAETWRRSGDDAWASLYLPAARAAADWLDRQRSKEWNHRVVRFEPLASGGLTVQSWKDSADSMVYPDGQRANPPLAVAEVQGYIYQALKHMAWMLRQAGENATAERLDQQASRLRENFHDIFWQEAQRYYAMAIDGEGKPLDVLSSDPGHCLWTGIVPPAFRADVVRRLVGHALFSGWGIRTLGSGEVAYDPYSYHRGSVWPHDTAIAVAGMARAGALNEAARVGQGLIDAAYRLPNHRLPELFAGEGRDVAASQPSVYPSACVPQAWAAGSPWLILQSLMGLRIDGRAKEIAIHPLPAVLQDVWFHIDGLGLTSQASISLRVDTERATVDGLPPDWTIKGVVGG